MDDDNVPYTIKIEVANIKLRRNWRDTPKQHATRVGKRAESGQPI